MVNDTRTQLAGRSANLATDPIVDNGLRAVRNALTELAHGAFFDQPQVGALVDQLSTKVDELDTYPGPTHPLGVAAAVQQAGQAISQMAVVLAGRARGPDDRGDRRDIGPIDRPGHRAVGLAGN